MPQELLFDQMKAVITRDLRLEGGACSAIRSSSASRALGVPHPRVVPIAPRPRAKSSARPLPPRAISSTAASSSTTRDLDAQRRTWLDSVANVRVHGTTRERPRDRFERDERASCSPLAAAALSPARPAGRATPGVAAPRRGAARVTVEKRAAQCVRAARGGGMKSPDAPSVRDRLRAQLADLSMPGALEALDAILRASMAARSTRPAAIEQLLAAQIPLRNNRRLQAAMRSCRLPAVKTLGRLRFHLSAALRREQIESLHELGFVERRENVIFLGPPGVGKTHLAICLAIAAAQSGRRVYYGTLADLITSLEEAQAAGRLQPRLKISRIPQLLVVDEIGYLPISRTGAMLFFQLMTRRYEHASTVLTSNKGFEEWGEIFGDDVMAAALIDRLVHHCHLVTIRGNSYRMRQHTDLAQLIQPPRDPITPRTRRSARQEA